MVPFFPAKGGGPDSGTPVQHIHLQPGIIRQQDAGDASGSGKRLERGVLRKRDSRFIHGRSLGIVGKILHFPFPGQHGADFPGLVGVARGNHQQRQFLFHNHQSFTVENHLKDRAQQSISRLTGQWSDPVTSGWMAASFTLEASGLETQK